ncbi:MAG: hypothetical protein J5577_07870 [Bacteroidales bacterium]|nr:hypothetical protein [Bacteroidales bacterium]MBR4818056.1 hypothetical protein [Bacteroidales bacterium]MBR5054078.1 hypothetical protein [Bacteroidales bacterium]
MKKFSFKRIGIIALAVVIFLLALRFIFYRETLWIGLALLLIGLIGFLVWKAFVKNGREDLRRSERKGKELEEEVTNLRKQIAGLYRELEEKGRSPLNVVELSPILHLAVMNIDSSFVRTYIREDEDAGLTFNGALRADICAEYGIKLEEVGFRYDAVNNTLYLADFRPGLISFSKKQLSWEIANSFASRSILGRNFVSASNPAAKAYTAKMCKELRDDLEKEIDDRKIAEFEWLSPMISQQVTDMLKMLVGRPGLSIVTMEGRPEGDYLSFPEFRKQIAAQVPQQIES